MDNYDSRNFYIIIVAVIFVILSLIAILYLFKFNLNSYNEKNEIMINKITLETEL